MSKQFVISVMSKDRPGIIADITGVILQFGGDLADLKQSVLGGYFSMILVAEFADSVTPEDLFAGFSHIDSATRIEATIMEMELGLEVEKKKLPGETYVVTVQAENRKGLVKVMGDFFHRRRINVLDLETVREKEMYTMIFQVDMTGISSMQTLRNEMQSLAESETLDLVFQHDDIYKATHEVSTPLQTMAA
ncbi:MAG: ACT domain-containing protein [Thermodesulfobacteriota bacterium]